MLLLLLFACLRDDPLPFAGDCAVYPDGVYEFGQIGIGTCLSGPMDLDWVDDSHLAIANANPWMDFTGGSVTLLDVSTLDTSVPENLISEVGVVAQDLPSFSGPMALDAERERLIVASRLSADARTRETNDSVHFVDVSDPTAPTPAEVGPDGASTVTVGWDPNAVLVDGDRGYVLNRTAHTISMLDLDADPVTLLPPGGEGSLTGNDFNDVDASGSRAAFSYLEYIEGAEVVDSHQWFLSWSVGTVRAWVSDGLGLWRTTSNGEGDWQQAGTEYDLDFSDVDLVGAVEQPFFFLDSDAIGHMFFTGNGQIWQAVEGDYLAEWTYYETPMVEAGEEDAVIGGPTVVVQDGTFYLFYDGGDGVTQSIYLATSVDGVNFDKEGRLLALDGASIAEPFVIYDAQGARWRMYFTRTDADGVGIGEAWSEDLLTWTVSDRRFQPTTGARAPAVAFYGGSFHLYYSIATPNGWQINEATSADGSTWTEVGAAFATGRDFRSTPPRIALQAADESAFRLENDAGEVVNQTLSAGGLLASSEGGWAVQVATGFALDATDAGLEDGGVSVDSVVGDTRYVTLTDEAGASSIGRFDGDVYTALLAAGAGGSFDADGVSHPVVVELDGQWHMYYAGSAGGVTKVGHATSSDGFTWAAAGQPVLSSVDDWDSVELIPGSAQVVDGTLRLWFSAYDGARYRIGLAESSNGSSFTRVAGDTYDWQFDAGSPGEWNDSGVRDPMVIADGDIEHLWFSGFSGEIWQIGYAWREGGGDWTVATDRLDAARPVLPAISNAFGSEGVLRPVVTATDSGTSGGGWSLWYTGYDQGRGRSGQALGTEPDRLYRDFSLPTLADTWSFTALAPGEGDAVSLDFIYQSSEYLAYGCTGLVADSERGFLYAACRLVPYLVVVDIRDDSTADFMDLNYLNVEAAVYLDTTTSAAKGLRDGIIDYTNDRLWAIGSGPEGIYAIDLTTITDDGSFDLVRDTLVGFLPLPRDSDRDEGEDTQASVGPGHLTLHPNGTHLFATNFNNNSVSVYDLSQGSLGALVGEVTAVGENPYAVTISSDGTRAYVGCYAGDVSDEGQTSSTLVVLDADPTSDTFLSVLTKVVNK